MNHVTVKLDFTNQQEAARVLPQTPLVSSDRAGWQWLTFTHYRHPPHQTVEHSLRQHSLVITSPKSCFQAERHLDGKFIRYGHGRGCIDIIPALLSRRTNWDREVEFSTIAICPTLIDRVVRSSIQHEIELMPQLAIDDPVIQQLALAIETEIHTGCMSGKLYGEALGMAIAARLVQNYAVSKPRLNNNLNGLSRLQLERVIDYIQVNLTRDLSISDLATLTSMSESHFSRSFKRSMGIAPYQYSIQQRVERAKQLLKQPASLISDIALDCGFANQTHLTRVFRQITGMTPKVYRRSQV